LILDGGYLNLDRLYYNESDFNIAYSACFELGMIWNLFQLADRGFKRVAEELKQPHSVDEYHSIALVPEEVNLIKGAYSSLHTLMKKGKHADRPPIPRDVVSFMVNHLKLMGRLGKVGRTLCAVMPLTSIIEAIHHDLKASEDKSIEIMQSSDIEALLDSVEQTIKDNLKLPLEDQVVDPLPWNLLSRICNPHYGEKSTSTSGNGENNINKKMQVEICRQLLASPFTVQDESPGWSIFAFRTTLQLTDPSHHYTTTNSRQSSKGRAQLLICTSYFGQCRPKIHENRDYVPVRPPSISPDICTDEQWRKVIAFRNTSL
jgi:hypothetical protein